MLQNIESRLSAVAASCVRAKLRSTAMEIIENLNNNSDDRAVWIQTEQPLAANGVEHQALPAIAVNTG